MEMIIKEIEQKALWIWSLDENRMIFQMVETFLEEISNESVVFLKDLHRIINSLQDFSSFSLDFFRRLWLFSDLVPLSSEIWFEKTNSFPLFVQFLPNFLPSSLQILILTFYSITANSLISLNSFFRFENFRLFKNQSKFPKKFPSNEKQNLDSMPKFRNLHPAMPWSVSINHNLHHKRHL